MVEHMFHTYKALGSISGSKISTSFFSSFFLFFLFVPSPFESAPPHSIGKVPAVYHEDSFSSALRGPSLGRAGQCTATCCRRVDSAVWLQPCPWAWPGGAPCHQGVLKRGVCLCVPGLPAANPKHDSCLVLRAETRCSGKPGGPT